MWARSRVQLLPKAIISSTLPLGCDRCLVHGECVRKQWNGEGKIHDLNVEILRGAQSKVQARKPVSSPPSQARTSHAGATGITCHSAGGGQNNRRSTTNQCTRRVVPAWDSSCNGFSETRAGKTPCYFHVLI